MHEDNLVVKEQPWLQISISFQLFEKPIGQPIDCMTGHRHRYQSYYTARNTVIALVVEQSVCYQSIQFVEFYLSLLPPKQATHA